MNKMKNRLRQSSLWKHDLNLLTKKEVHFGFTETKRWYIFSPEDSAIDIWSKFMTLILFYTAIVTPYTVSFVEVEDQNWSAVEYVISAIFFLDFLLNCFTAYYDDKKNLICNHKQILSNYFFGWMIPDIFACLPITLILNQDKHYNSLVRVARLPRLYRLFKITKLLKIVKVMKNSSQILKHMNYIFKISAAFERFFWFGFTYVLLVHIVACLWVFVGKFDNTSVNWIQIGNFEDCDNVNLYVISLYWTITTVTTVGYGDIVATNLSEKFFTIIVMTIGIIFYSYSISSITNVIKSIDTRKAKLKHQLITLDNIEKEYHINKEFYLQISKALEFVNNRSKQDIQDFVSDLPGSLGNQVLIVTYEKLLAGNAFFEKRTTDFVAWVAPRLHFCRIDSNKIIYTDEDYASQMYFITAGIVEFVLIMANEIVPYIEIQKDYYFGEVDLLFSDNKNHLHCTRAGVMCELLTLSKENFYSLLSTYPDESTEICIRAQQRLQRIDNELKEVEINLKNQVPIDKRKTYPKLSEMHPMIVLAKHSDSEAASSNGHQKKNQNLFREILESKLKIKEADGKSIKKKVLEVHDEAEGLRDVIYKLQDIISIKDKNFSRKFPKFSPETSSVDSNGGTNYES